MATSTVPRLAPVNARDGVDTRPDNGEKDLTTRVGASHDRDAQTAAITYLLPPGAEVEGSNMAVFWRNYMRTADAYAAGDPLHHFRFTSFRQEQSHNEEDIAHECRKLGAGEEMLNVYRQFYNAAVTEWRAEPRWRQLDNVDHLLEQFNKELEAQNRAATIIQQAYKASKTGTLMAEDCEEHGTCIRCFQAPRMRYFSLLCADCYWSEDAVIKQICREKRGF